MPVHKFAVGQKDRFTSDPGQAARRSQSCVILRLRPERGSVPQYQVKGDLDDQVRSSGQTN
jgi:hypothetical protein